MAFGFKNLVLFGILLGMARRGPYAKGIAKRDEILSTALEVIARQGYSKATVRQIADAVGLSQAGLLHYFGSKEALFTEVLRRRDELDGAAMTADSAKALPRFVDLVRRNETVPGLVQLYVRLAADATDPEHHAHDYFVERTRLLHGVFTGMVLELQESGEVTRDIPAETITTMVHALADGLQTQWMLDPTLDMSAVIETFIATLAPRS